MAGAGWHYHGRLVAWYVPLDVLPAFSRLPWLQTLQPPPLPAGELPPTEDEAEIQFRAACDFFRKKKYSYAGVAFQEVIGLDRQRDDARRWMAISFLAAGQGERAVIPLTRLQQRWEDGAAEGELDLGEIAFLQGLAYGQQGLYGQAADWWLAVAATPNPYQAEALRRLTQLPGWALLPPSARKPGALSGGEGTNGPAGKPGQDPLLPENREPDNSEEEQPSGNGPA